MPDKTQILIIGSLPPPFGGTTVSLAHLVDGLQVNPNVKISTINLNDEENKRVARRKKAWHLLTQLPKEIASTDVVTLHCCTKTLFVQALPIFILSKLYNKPLLIRKFAGTDYWLNGSWRGRLNAFILKKCDAVLLQTKQLVQLAKERGLQNVHWFPTHRPMQHGSTHEAQEKCKRFIYVGHVREAKGVLTLVEAAKLIPAHLSVDVYGNMFDDLPKDLFSNGSNIKYMGSLSPSEVVETMRQCDAFVFPTHHVGEGYPGVILEAYCAGLPVISTRWLAIPEIVDDSVGILIDPKDPKQLADAMNRLADDPVLFHKLATNAAARAEMFSVKKWAAYFSELCRDLARKG